MRGGENGVELAADRLSKPGAELGRFGGRPDAAESKARAHIRFRHAEKLAEKTAQLRIVAVVSQPCPLQPWPQLALDVFPRVADAAERILPFPEPHVVQ